MAALGQTTISNILSAEQKRLEASLAFDQALRNAASARDAAIINLGADIRGMGGTIMTPDQVGDILGPDKKGTLQGTTMSVGFGDTTLPTITKAGTGAVFEAKENLAERGVGTTSGLVGQQRTTIGEATDIEKQQAIQAAQGEITEANAAQIAAFGERAMAEAGVEAARGRAPGQKNKVKPKTQAQQEAAKQRASARAAANAKAKEQGKPLPYPKPNQGPPPAPSKKKGKK